MTKVKINKAQTIRELLVNNPSVNWAEVQAEFKKRGTTVTQAQFYQVRTAEKNGGMKKKKRTTKKTTRQVVAAKTKAPVSSTLGTDAITFRDNLYQFMTKAQRELGKDTVNAATQSVFDQLG
tara:strand:+ start:6447 stop:6812 length:366 start_codon:yes stop_codon:yes gene_type:complete